MKKSSKELAEQIDTAAARAAAATGDYKALASAMNAASESTRQKVLNEGASTLRQMHLDKGSLTDGSAVQDYREQVQSKVGSTLKTGATQVILGQHQVDAGASFVETLKEANAALEELNQTEQRYKALAEEDRPNNYDQIIEDIHRAQDAIQQWKNQEDVAEGSNILEGMFGTQAEMEGFQATLKNCGGDIDAIFQLLSENENTSGYFNSLTTDAEKLNAVLSILQDKSQQLAVS